jgi:hypothetical protein
VEIGNEDTQRRGVAHGTETRFARPQRIPVGLAFEQEASARGNQWASTWPFDEIVSGAALHRLARGRFIARCAENHDQRIGGRQKNLIEGIETPTIRQRQVKQHHLDTASDQSLERSGQSCHPLDGEPAVADTGKGLLDQAGISRIPFDEQDTGQSLDAVRRGSPRTAIGHEGRRRKRRTLDAVVPVTLLELLDLLVGLVLRDAVALLQFAGQLDALAGNHVQFVVCEFAPLGFHLALELLPVTFNDIPVHLELLFSEIDGRNCPSS